MSRRRKHYIIYISGFGDSKDSARKLALKGWRLWGVRTELVPMQWFDGRSFKEKEQRVLAAVRRARSKGYAVSLIGESAGGSMAINVAAQLPDLHALIILCGVSDPRTPISPETLEKAPAFDVSVRLLNESLLRIPLEKTHTIRAWYDSVVYAKHSYVKDASNHRFITIGHVLTITLFLTVLSVYIATLIKRNY